MLVLFCRKDANCVPTRNSDRKEGGALSTLHHENIEKVCATCLYAVSDSLFSPILNFNLNLIFILLHSDHPSVIF
jgi:hypothetical protein